MESGKAQIVLIIFGFFSKLYDLNLQIYMSGCVAKQFLSDGPVFSEETCKLFSVEG